MNQFIEERAKLIRSLAEKADPFTKARLLKLAEHYEGRLRKASRPPKAVAVTSVAVNPTQRVIAAIAGVPRATER
jgi:hypothetical protein